MPTSAYMDRNDPKVPQLQSSFIKHLVQPLYVAYEKAGILPGEWVEVDSDENEDEEDFHENGDETNSQSDEDNKSEGEKSLTKKKVIYNVVTDNINKNHQKWLKIIEEEAEQSGENLSEASKEESENSDQGKDDEIDGNDDGE